MIGIYSSSCDNDVDDRLCVFRLSMVIIIRKLLLMGKSSHEKEKQEISTAVDKNMISLPAIAHANFP